MKANSKCIELYTIINTCKLFIVIFSTLSLVLLVWICFYMVTTTTIPRVHSYVQLIEIRESSWRVSIWRNRLVVPSRRTHTWSLIEQRSRTVVRPRCRDQPSEHNLHRSGTRSLRLTSPTSTIRLRGKKQNLWFCSNFRSPSWIY